MVPEEGGGGVEEEEEEEEEGLKRDPPKLRLVWILEEEDEEVEEVEEEGFESMLQIEGWGLESEEEGREHEKGRRRRREEEEEEEELEIAAVDREKRSSREVGVAILRRGGRELASGLVKGRKKAAWGGNEEMEGEGKGGREEGEEGRGARSNGFKKVKSELHFSILPFSLEPEYLGEGPDATVATSSRRPF